MMEQNLPVLEITGLKRRYGIRPVLKGIDLTLGGGKIVGLLGPNGVGKTTLMKIVAGLLTPTAGSVTVAGHPIGAESKALVSYLPERTYLADWMRVYDAVELFSDFYADFDPERAMEMLTRLDVDPEARFRTLSKGTREKVQLVLVMSRKALLYVLDEPIGGVDPAARDYILSTILTNYNEEGTILISTHLISDIESVLDEVVFLKDGQILLHDSVDHIRQERGKSVDGVFREVFQC